MSKRWLNRDKLIPVAVTLLLSAIVVVLYFASRAQDRETIQETVDARADGIQLKITGRLTELSNAMKRFAARVEVIGIKNEEYLTVDSKNYLAQIPLLARIGIVDAQMKTIWSYPIDVRAQVAGFDQSTIPERREAFEAARSKGIPFLSRTVELRSGGFGNLLPVALWHNKTFNGAVYGAIKINRLLKDLEEPDLFELQFLDRDKPVFVSSSTQDGRPEYKTVKTIPFGFADFSIGMVPTEKFVALHESRTPHLILLFGELFALGCGFVLHKYLLNHRRRLIELEWRRAMLDDVGHAVIAFDADGVIQMFTRSAEKLLGFNSDEMVGRQTPSIFLAKSELTERADELTKELGHRVAPGLAAFTAKPGVAREWTFVTKDHQHIPVNVSTTAIRGIGGAITGYLGIATDLREEKRTAKDLVLAHERFQRVVAVSGSGIWERDLHTKEVLYTDSRFRKILGFSPDAEIGFEDVVSRIEPDDRETISNHLLIHQAEQTPSFEFEARLNDEYKELENRWVRVNGRIIKDGDRARLVSTITDVTDSVHARLQLEKALSDSKAAAIAKSAFFSVMSHEIRTPLNGIIGMNGLLLETPLTEKQQQLAEIVKQSSHSLLALLNDVLDFSKLESGKVEIETSTFSVAPVVENQVEILFAKAREKSLSLASFVSPEIPSRIQGDPGRLGQILLNLISNALKFTAQGGVSVNVAPTADRRALRFEIRDTGIGIEKHEIERLFQPFSQANASVSSKFGGTGLGLSICKKIVEAMDGDIGVESELGVGSTFWFEIPLKAAALHPAESLGWERISGLKTLIVEPDPVVSHALMSYISSWKMVGTVASSLKSAEVQAHQLVLVSQKFMSEAGDALKDIPAIVLQDFSELGEIEGRVKLDTPVKQSALLDAIVKAVFGQTSESRVSRKAVAAPRATEQSGFKILVADDVAVNRMLTEAMLSYLGHSSVSVSDGNEALAALERESFDLVLMDCQMPGMDGYQATAAIRTSKDSRIRTMPVIALTANAMSGDAAKCKRAGMNDYLPKPLIRDDLARVLNQWLKTKNKVS